MRAPPAQEARFWAVGVTRSPPPVQNGGGRPPGGRKMEFWDPPGQGPKGPKKALLATGPGIYIGSKGPKTAKNGQKRQKNLIFGIYRLMYGLLA